MEITRPDQIDGAAASQLRAAEKKSQPEFWGPFGISKSRASAYETGKRDIPEECKILIYLIHVCRFPIGLPHEVMLQIGAALNSAAEGMKKLKQAAVIAEAAIDHLKSAQKCMEEN